MQTIEEVGTIPGAGTSVQPLTYHTDDKKPYTGTSYYRLKQVDFDGHINYSAWQSVYIDYPVEQNVNVTVNPAEQLFNISFQNVADESKFHVQLIDMTGRIVWQTVVDVTQPNQSFQFSSKDFAKGIYLITVGHDSNTGSFKVVF